MKEMMTNVDFYVTPVLNVDGYMYTWENSTDDTVSTRNEWIFTLYLLGSWAWSTARQGKDRIG